MSGGTGAFDTITNSAQNGAPNFLYGATFSRAPIVSGGPFNIGTTNYQILTTDGYSLIYTGTTLTAGITATLPAASSSIGRSITFSKLDTGNFTFSIAPSGSDTINGVNSTYGRLTQYGAKITLTCYSSSGWMITSASGIAPTVQKLTTGTSQTYTTPSWVTNLHVKMVGGGGGGGGGGTGSPVAGGTGGTTSFGTSLLTCNGGVGGSTGTAPAVSAGGTATINSPAYGTAVQGGTGTGGASTASASGAGFPGASSPFGGAGASAGAGSGATLNAIANSGSGAGGGGTTTTAIGGGGGAGGFVDAIIPFPSSTYTYSIGASGTTGAGGTNGGNGGAGGSGYIEVTEYYC